MRTRTVAEQLARRAVELHRTAPSPQADAAAANAIVDWFGVTIAGSTAAPARALAGGLSPMAAHSRLIGTHERAVPFVAALINGTAAHTLELDDIYAPGLFHPGAPIIASALAVADERSASMTELKSAVTVGYEVGCRVARDLGPDHYARWHTTGTAGTIGAAAAACALLHLPTEPFAHALSLAATMSAGLQQTFRSDAMGKPLHSGNAAHGGVVAAVAAAGGVTGARDVFEGGAGLAAATGAATSWCHSAAPVEGPLAIEQITVKPYPCCGHTFAPIAASIKLHATAINVDDILRIDVQTYAAAIAVAGIETPRTPVERRFSIPFSVARALIDGAITESSFQASNSRIDALGARVTMTVEPEFDDAFPDRRGAALTATMASGQQHRIRVDDRPGSPENPMGPEAIDAKFLAAVTPTLRARTGHALHQLRGGASRVGELIVV